MTALIDWSDDNDRWGVAGHNVHIASNGSHVPSVHGQEQEN